MTKINMNGVEKEVSDAPEEETKSGVISLVIENLKSFPAELLEGCKTAAKGVWKCIKIVADVTLTLVKVVAVVTLPFITYIAFTAYSAWAWPILGIVVVWNCLLIIGIELCAWKYKRSVKFLCYTVITETPIYVNLRENGRYFIINGLFSKSAIVIPADDIDNGIDKVDQAYFIKDKYTGFRGSLSMKFAEEIKALNA